MLRYFVLDFNKYSVRTWPTEVMTPLPAITLLSLHVVTQIRSQEVTNVLLSCFQLFNIDEL